MATPEQIIELRRLAQRWTLQNPSFDIVDDSENYLWFTRELQRLLRSADEQGRLILPNLRDDNETIAIYSDYGGESPDSRYLTYSFLVCAWNQSEPFTSRMKEIRAAHGLNDPFKEIAFKDFRYGPIKRALPDYLSALSNLVNGFLLTVIVDKNVGTVLGGETASESKRHVANILKNEGFGDWKPAVAEKVVVICHFISYLVALLSKPDQKVFWMTDHDSIAEPAERFERVLDLLQRLLHHYSPHQYALLGGATPFEEKAPGQMDMLSAPDIVAGALEHYFTRRSKAKSDEPLITEQTNQVLEWLTGDGVGLKRQTMFIRKCDVGYEVGTIIFSLKEERPDAVYIPVSTKKA